MSGPSLKKQDAHSSIHEASLNEAKELNELFRMCLKEGQMEKAFQVAEVIIDHWESRTLKHAEAEEEGLYVEMIKENPPVLHLVIQLTRDHELMRRIVEQVKIILTKNEMNVWMLSLFDSLIVIDSIHTAANAASWDVFIEELGAGISFIGREFQYNNGPILNHC